MPCCCWRLLLVLHMYSTTKSQIIVSPSLLPASGVLLALSFTYYRSIVLVYFLEETRKRGAVQKSDACIMYDNLERQRFPLDALSSFF